MSDLPIDFEWLWLIGGVILLIAELIAPGFFLVFIGAAAIATGLAALLLPIGVALQLALFALLAYLAARIGGRRAYSMRYDYSPDPFLNDRAKRLLGRVVVVTQPVDSNGGRVRVGDSEWSARGGPAAAGDRVRIVDIEGNCLKVEAEHVLPPAAPSPSPPSE
ncbi:NfeD family protein [Sphingomonas segetis]|jgi:membrane protein implicated in regulation of membrane protease activity|uniref:NfeD family protein n=1 Tax=Sphingomonas segetis TaxID=1104779 RepID=UPI0012D33D8A|nr:NfeD family protein [Sphingomonas segetis]